MIAKQRTTSNAGEAVRYLRVGPRGKEVDEADRVDWSTTRNLLVDDDLTVARQIMESTAQLSDRVENPYYTMSVSFHPDDQVDRKTMERVADEVLKDLGLEDHQTIIVAHKDRDHAHFHCLVNRVDLETGKAWKNSHDWSKTDETLRRLEKELDLKQVRSWRDLSPDKPVPVRASQRDFVEELRDQQVGAVMRDSSSWDELSDRLGERGLVLQRAGRGLQVTDGEKVAKVSALHRKSSLAGLEKRFGETWKQWAGRDQTVVEPPEPRRLSRPAPEIQQRVDELQQVGEQIRRHHDAVDRIQVHNKRAVDLANKRNELDQHVAKIDTAVKRMKPDDPRKMQFLDKRRELHDEVRPKITKRMEEQARKGFELKAEIQPDRALSMPSDEAIHTASKGVPRAQLEAMEQPVQEAVERVQKEAVSGWDELSKLDSRHEQIHQVLEAPKDRAETHRPRPENAAVQHEIPERGPVSEERTAAAPPLLPPEQAAFVENLRADGVGETLEKAFQWQDLRDRLTDHGLILQKAGDDLQVTDGETAASLAAFDQDLPTLEQRFSEPWSQWADREPTVIETKPRDVPAPAPEIQKGVDDLNRIAEQIRQHHEALRRIDDQNSQAKALADRRKKLDERVAKIDTAVEQRLAYIRPEERPQLADVRADPRAVVESIKEKDLVGKRGFFSGDDEKRTTAKERVSEIPILIEKRRELVDVQRPKITKSMQKAVTDRMQIEDEIKPGRALSMPSEVQIYHASRNVPKPHLETMPENVKEAVKDTQKKALEGWDLLKRMAQPENLRDATKAAAQLLKTIKNPKQAIKRASDKAILAMLPAPLKGPFKLAKAAAGASKNPGKTITNTLMSGANHGITLTMTLMKAMAPGPLKLVVQAVEIALKAAMVITRTVAQSIQNER